MKRFLSIFFLSIYLFSYTEARELLKLPIVFQHFQEHKILNPDLSFLDFLDIHYMHGSSQDDDYGRDMQLPFKTPFSSNFANANFILTTPDFLTEQKIPQIVKKPLLSYTHSGYSYNFHSSIWQPPKIS